MYLNSEVKRAIYKEHGKSTEDTGSTEGQIAQLTLRIAHLTEHLKSNRKDFGTQRTLLNMVGRRRKFLEYLKAKDIEGYRALIKKLNLRK
jgi:small subunit ribosomal protein S15